MTGFHQSKMPAAVLKHEIINQYATPFASKTGSTSPGARVAFIDGYAGPGRYNDGAEGSGAMLLRKAHELAAMNSPRQVELHFVEQDPQTVAKLRHVVDSEGAGLDPEPTVTDGDISTHLPALLGAASGIPLFVYLDPCGLIIPMDEVATIFERPVGLGAPATEVLINLTAHLRRFAGMLTSKNVVDASLKRIDDVCGGDWWRQAWLEHLPDKDAAEKAVVAGYAQKLRERAHGAGTWIIAVKPRADLKPLYYLVFATRHRDGLLYFGESASLGQEKWRRYHAEHNASDDLFGAAEDWEIEWKAQEALLRAKWIDTIAERLTTELAKGEAFRIVERPTEVLSDLVGVVRNVHMRAAIKKVHTAGKTSTNPTGVKDMLTLRITPS